ncbi:carboxylate--amine ligase/circularly permuted type 2 ATP-grasp protein [Frigoribacterium sp. VKM Ac-2836]|uniref:carboxylate--amine ligase/circularly permuted type 2 ATP-grasp protein n=1 Tax=Frigoribacterium sp. VKM Ac-2836 TaxID=2739014 RepID=UPI001564C960|nr:carboxylate--amine ligase/circularly permuted type 2 ATP-grasp protein [Frigoribacterium sp. VKM Ac-2836]NRD27677.1 carboxylate--amine ligase/circularly permuted type 2 ATP-grasp protein [Frigoribacterium sp. VKM Ac-2836]
MSAELTLGAEEELHLIDLETKRLSARAPHLLARLPADRYGAELQRTTIETNVPVVTTLGDLRREILTLRRDLVEVTTAEGLAIGAVGTAPRSEFADFELTTTGRYGRMHEQYRLLVDEQLICGLQIHVGVADRDLAVQIAGRVAPVLPALLALSASSPYWNGQDTGYASIRSIIWQRWPSAGATGPMADAAEYDRLLADLIDTGVIADSKMAYFDVRPSSHAPTLELRTCDACPLVDDAVLIAGLFRAAVRRAETDIEAGRPAEHRAAPLHRAAMWQAARGGLGGELLDLEQHPSRLPAAEAVRQLVARLRPQLEELGDWQTVTDLAEATLARGNSADRQRAAFAERGRLDDVVDLVVHETHGPAAGLDAPSPTLVGYRFRAGDEAIGPGLNPRPAYRDVARFFRELDATEARARGIARDTWCEGDGLGFGVGGDHRVLHCDLVPRIVTHHEWSRLAAGLTQRARAVESFLRDAYGERRIVADGVLGHEQVVGAAGWREEATRLPADAVRAAVQGFDLVRDELGGWRVLEDNLRSPSGAAYSIAARRVLDEVVPDAPRPAGLLDPTSVFAVLRATLLAHAAPPRVGGAVARESVGAVLTEGPTSPAWYEHRTLAEGAGLSLLQAEDVEVREARVVDRRTGTVVDALYLRLDRELVEVHAPHDPLLGEHLMDVAAAGGVVLVNAPGNGLVDDKAMYCAVPDLIWYYLGERPLLESVPTYRAGDPAERLAVLDRVGELVTKPVGGEGGRGVLIGPSASAAVVAERRAEIAHDPAGWVAQEVVTLSSHPTLTSTGLQPRHVDLRCFVYLTGTGEGESVLADLGLTRVAPEGSMIVNSSQGGGAKDTWIMGEPPAASEPLEPSDPPEPR